MELDSPIVWRENFIIARQVRGLSRRALANELGVTLNKHIPASYIRGIEKNVHGSAIDNKTFRIPKSRLRIIGYVLGFTDNFFINQPPPHFKEPIFICTNPDSLPDCVKCFYPTDLLCDTCDNSICFNCAIKNEKGDFCGECNGL